MIQETTPLQVDTPKAAPPPVPPLRIGVPAKRRLARRSSMLLFAPDEAESFRSRWLDIQASFVDEPGGSVEQADLLVAEVMKQLARTFAQKRSKLELQLVQGEQISTEELRMALRRYRSFFDRLLSI
jgi:hypothetical protein